MLCEPPTTLQCYKLGKRRFSYNQVELLLSEAGGGQRRAVVTQAAPASSAKLPAACQVRGGPAALASQLCSGLPHSSAAPPCTVSAFPQAASSFLPGC